MKYAPYIGILAAIILIIACFMPWAYYPDIKQTFTGFYSEQNQYGKPGKAFIFLAVAVIILFLVPKLWAKRLNQFLCIIILAFAIKAFYLFSACYQGICPERKTGLYLVMITAISILVSGLLSGIKISGEKKSQ